MCHHPPTPPSMSCDQKWTERFLYNEQSSIKVAALKQFFLFLSFSDSVSVHVPKPRFIVAFYGTHPLKSGNNSDTPLSERKKANSQEKTEK